MLLLAASMAFFLFFRGLEYRRAPLYLTLMNVLIGLKVCSGLWLIYLSFYREVTCRHGTMEITGLLLSSGFTASIRPRNN